MDNPETLYFKDEWKPVYNPVQYETHINNEEPAEEEQPKLKKKSDGKPLLMIIQIVFCIITLLSLYALKSFSADLFKEIQGWYENNLNNEIIMSESFESLSLDNLINAAKDK